MTSFREPIEFSRAIAFTSLVSAGLRKTIRDALAIEDAIARAERKLGHIEADKVVSAAIKLHRESWDIDLTVAKAINLAIDEQLKLTGQTL